MDMSHLAFELVRWIRRRGGHHPPDPDAEAYPENGNTSPTNGDTVGVHNEVFRYRAHARVDRVYDGDTFFGRHRPDPTTIIAMDEAQRNDPNDDAGQYYRLSGVDTHELRSGTAEEREMAKDERDWAQAWVEAGRLGYTIEGSHEAWPFVLIYASEKFEGSFGRPLCDLIRKTDGEHLSTALIEAFPDRNLVYQGATPSMDTQEPASSRETHPERDAPPAGLPWAASPEALRD